MDTLLQQRYYGCQVEGWVGCFVIHPGIKRAYLTTKSKDLIEEHDDATADTDADTEEVTVCTGAVVVLDTGQVSRLVLEAGLESTDYCM